MPRRSGRQSPSSPRIISTPAAGVWLRADKIPRMSSTDRKRSTTSRQAPLMLHCLISSVAFIPLPPRCRRERRLLPGVPSLPNAPYPPQGAVQSLERGCSAQTDRHERGGEHGSGDFAEAPARGARQRSRHPISKCAVVASLRHRSGTGREADRRHGQGVSSKSRRCAGSKESEHPTGGCSGCAGRRFPGRADS